MRKHEDALGLSHESIIGTDDGLLRRAIAYYQGASYAFQKGLIAWRSGLLPDEKLGLR